MSTLAEKGNEMTSQPPPEPDDVHELLRPYAAAPDDPVMPLEGNYLLGFLNASPEHAAKMFQQQAELRRGSTLGVRLIELVRLTVANRTGCPV